MNKRRLLKLADLLEADAKNKRGVKFDLSMWGRVGDNEHWPDTPNVIPVDCGTTACAIGLACISGAFKRSGLTYKVGHYGENSFVPIFGELRDFDAVTAFFGICRSEAFLLFDAVEYEPKHRSGARGERAVAKRIRNFVAGKAVAP